MTEVGVGSNDGNHAARQNRISGSPINTGTEPPACRVCQTSCAERVWQGAVCGTSRLHWGAAQWMRAAAAGTWASGWEQRQGMKATGSGGNVVVYVS